MVRLDDDLDTTALPTITEEDGDSSVRSGSTTKSKEKDEAGFDEFLAVIGKGKDNNGGTSSNNTNNTSVAAASAAATGRQSPTNNEVNSNESSENKAKKKKKKRGKRDKDPLNGYSPEDHDTAQQILVDLCTEMKDLKASMQRGQEKTSENLDSNQQVIRQLADQMQMLQGNMHQLDVVIESKATPEQIEDLARIRAVQEMMKVVTDDKERTVSVYEQHARRGYEEIERLRQDLESERKEVAALRAELDIVRGDRQRMMSSGGGAGGGGGGLLSPGHNMYINAGDSVGGDSGAGGSQHGPGAMYINGGVAPGRKFSASGGGIGGDFDDMTLETKGSYETVQYEMKSLKKRIIHMKKKLTVAQMEAKETSTLRSEVERLRVQCETEKKGSLAKDETIKRLEQEVKELKRNQANAAAALSSFNKQNSASSSGSSGIGGSANSGTAATTVGAPTRRPSPPQAGTARTSTKTVVKKNKWWQNL